VSTEAHSFITIPLETLHEPKLQFFNASKSHLMPKFSKIYAYMCTNLGIVVLRKSFEASWLPQIATHSFRGLSNSKEEKVEEIVWTSK
jgi:hypothetical protein